jgi:16S rRNA (guanine527-N7)-methyltransferase
MSPPERAPLEGAIAAEAARLGLEVPAASLPGLAAYAERLWSWNERLNLTRHTDVDRYVSRDVADAVAIAARLATGERVLDVGTGGGVPGVLLAILRPDLRVELSESVGKRARAVAEIVAEIGLTVPMHACAAQGVVRSRATGPDRFDTLVVRAVASLSKLLGWFEPLADSFGRLLVVKGPRWEEERDAARLQGLTRRVVVRRVATWPIRGSDNESVLLEVASRG